MLQLYSLVSVCLLSLRHFKIVSWYEAAMALQSKCMAYDYKSFDLCDSYDEYECRKTDISVVGSLARHYQRWVDMKAPPFILKIVKRRVYDTFS